MQDDELKKILKEMHLDDVVKELEEEQELKQKQNSETWSEESSNVEQFTGELPATPAPAQVQLQVQLQEQEQEQDQTQTQTQTQDQAEQIASVKEIESSHLNSRGKNYMTILTKVRLLAALGLFSFGIYWFIHTENRSAATSSSLVAQIDQDQMLSSSAIGDEESEQRDEQGEDSDQDGEQNNEEEQDEYEESKLRAIAWAQKINDINPEIAKGVQVLWNMLERREDDLCDIADELTDLLYENARIQLDYSSKEASVLLSRYEAMNARLAFDISRQIYLLDKLVLNADNPVLEQSFHELLSELGCETYKSYQMEVVKQLLLQEEGFQECLTAIEKSQSLSELQQTLQDAKSSFKLLKKNGYAKTFLRLNLLQREIPSAVHQALNQVIQNKVVTFDTDSQALLSAILAQSDMESAEQIRITQRFATMAKKSEAQEVPNEEKSAVSRGSEIATVTDLV